MESKHPSLTGLAKSLRKRSTEAEKIVWQKIRAGQLNGFKFKRQQPIGPYIVDYVCFEKNLIIEIDGGQHAVEKDKDIKRDTWLQSEGFVVTRFWNNEIFENLEGVLETIIKKIEAPSP